MSNPTIQIIGCQQSDIPTLADVAIRAYRDHYTYLWADNGAWYEERCFTHEALRSEMNQASSAFYLIHQNEEPIGYMKINDTNPLEGYPATTCLEVERIYLLKTAMSGGIGRVAMNFAENLARKQGRNVIWLKAMDSSPAVHFYEKVGFRKCGQARLTFSLMKEEFRNMFVMKKELV